MAEGGQGGAQGSALNEALKKGGLTYKDVEHVYMGYPQHVPALVNGSVDFSVTAEPSATQALQTRQRSSSFTISGSIRTSRRRFCFLAATSSRSGAMSRSAS